MNEQQSKHPQLHAYMSNLLESGARHERVREQGEECAIEMIYQEFRSTVQGVSLESISSRATVMVLASEMVLQVCHELGLSSKAIKERIGR